MCRKWRQGESHFPPLGGNLGEMLSSWCGSSHSLCQESCYQNPSCPDISWQTGPSPQRQSAIAALVPLWHYSPPVTDRGLGQGWGETLAQSYLAHEKPSLEPRTLAFSHPNTAPSPKEAEAAVTTCFLAKVKVLGEVFRLLWFSHSPLRMEALCAHRPP